VNTVAAITPVESRMPAGRLRKLQTLGIFCGVVAGAWLGGAEAPIKMVNPEVSPITVSLIMVFGVFLARWSMPALLCGTSSVRYDVRQAPHLVVWAVLAGCMWAAANTLTIYAIRNVGLSIAFPLWNANSLLGIFWGFLLFNELHHAGWKRWLGVLGGAATLFAGATLLALASSSQAAPGKAMLGVIAALGAGVLWGTMYIPYRKAYLTGMNPLSFLTFFTVGELVTMIALAVGYKGAARLWQELMSARSVFFWLMLGGFVWVIGDLFQQYAAKYVGISRGIPLSNTNQLWGLLWGILVFHELQGGNRTVYSQVIGGSVLMGLGALAIALSSASEREHSSWRDAAQRESQRYGVEEGYVCAGMEGREFEAGGKRRTLIDRILIAATSAVFIGSAAVARLPRLDMHLTWAAALAAAMVVLLVSCGISLGRTTGFR
jgi:drug/metabolite transporter (DMT)-like permease